MNKLLPIENRLTATSFMGQIEFKSLLFILSMSIMVTIAERYKIFQYVAVSAIHLCKSNPRRFFYLICIISSFSGMILEDMTVAIIFVPLVIRATKILKIPAAPYLFGINITINLGAYLTPFSGSTNIIFSSYFDLPFSWFFTRFALCVIPLLFLNLYLLDRILLKEIPNPSPELKQVLMEIMDPKLVIIQKRLFLINSIYFGVVIIAFLFVPEPYLVAVIGALIMGLINRENIGSTLTKVDWKSIFYFISLFLIIGCMILNGTMELVRNFVVHLQIENILLFALAIFLISGFASSFSANTPIMMLFIPIIKQLIEFDPKFAGHEDLLLMGLLFGVVLGGNLLPQGAAYFIISLNIAQTNHIEGFTFKTYFKYGGFSALVQIIFCMIYLVLFALVTGTPF